MKFWEFYFFVAISVIICLVLLVDIGRMWWYRRRQWKRIRPYYGAAYDASDRTYRPNVDLRRVR